jgi:hypothetical protein
VREPTQKHHPRDKTVIDRFVGGGEAAEGAANRLTVHGRSLGAGGGPEGVDGVSFRPHRKGEWRRVWRNYKPNIVAFLAAVLLIVTVAWMAYRF